MKKRKNIVWLVLLIFIFISGCKSSFIENKINSISYENNVINQVAASFLEFETFSARLEIDSEFDNDNHKFKGSLRIKRDSIVWISVNLTTGLPIAKLQFETDSFKILDRIGDKLYIGDYSDLENKLNVKLNFEIIQSAFINEISACEKYGNSVDRKVFLNGDSILIDCVVKENELPKFVLNYIVNSANKKIEQINIANDNKYCLIKYSKFEEVEDKLFPEQCKIKLVDKNRTINLDIEYNKIRLNKKLKFPFKIKKKVIIIR